MRYSLPALLFAVVLIAGCDTAGLSGGETIILSTTATRDANGQAFRYTFSASDLQTGRLTDLRCDCPVDLGPYLTTQGFSRSDLVSASLVDARLVMLFPLSEQANFLSNAILKLEAPGLSATEVANQNAFPTAREVNLSILANRDIASYIDRSSFSPVLQINPARLTDGEDYEIGLSFTVRFELSGI